MKTLNHVIVCNVCNCTRSPQVINITSNIVDFSRQPKVLVWDSHILRDFVWLMGIQCYTLVVATSHPSMGCSACLGCLVSLNSASTPSFICCNCLTHAKEKLVSTWDPGILPPHAQLGKHGISVPCFAERRNTYIPDWDATVFLGLKKCSIRFPIHLCRFRIVVAAMASHCTLASRQSGNISSTSTAKRNADIRRPQSASRIKLSTIEVMGHFQGWTRSASFDTEHVMRILHFHDIGSVSVRGCFCFWYIRVYIPSKNLRI